MEPTAIGRRITAAIRHLEDFRQTREVGSLESAMIEVMLAADATAKKVVPGEKSNKKRMKKFFADYEWLIVGIGSDVAMSGYKSDGTTVPDVLYEHLRCALIHEGEPSSDVEFVSDYWTQLGSNNMGWVLPERYIDGIVAAVVVAPENAEEYAGEDLEINFHGGRFALLDRSWGELQGMIKVHNQHFHGIY